MLLIRVLNTLEVIDDIALTHVSREIFADTGTSAEDTENFSNFPRMIKSVKLSAFFTETGDNHWKASLRSTGGLNAAKIAGAFGGGGHRNAAGFTFRADLKALKQAFLAAVKSRGL